MVRLDLLPHTEYILECRSRMQGREERKGLKRIGKEKTGVEEEGRAFHRPGVLWSSLSVVFSAVYCLPIATYSSTVTAELSLRLEALAERVLPRAQYQIFAPVLVTRSSHASLPFRVPHTTPFPITDSKTCGAR